MYFCNTGLECEECSGCENQLEKKCDECGRWIFWNEEACSVCLKIKEKINASNLLSGR